MGTQSLSLIALLTFIYYAPAIYKRIINNIKVRLPKSFCHFSNVELYTWIAEVFPHGGQFGPVYVVYRSLSLPKVCKRNGRRGISQGNWPVEYLTSSMFWCKILSIVERSSKYRCYSSGLSWFLVPTRLRTFAVPQMTSFARLKRHWFSVHDFILISDLT